VLVDAQQRLSVMIAQEAALRQAAAQRAARLAALRSAQEGLQARLAAPAAAQCESGGDPGAISSSGLYRGKYQFDPQTWRSVGGSGDPAAAPEAEQDRRAAMLYAQRGSSPWPVCGR
jgi:hypothetical protein